MQHHPGGSTPVGDRRNQRLKHRGEGSLRGKGRNPSFHETVDNQPDPCETVRLTFNGNPEWLPGDRSRRGRFRTTARRESGPPTQGVMGTVDLQDGVSRVVKAGETTGRRKDPQAGVLNLRVSPATRTRLERCRAGLVQVGLRQGWLVGWPESWLVGVRQPAAGHAGMFHRTPHPPC